MNIEDLFPVSLEFKNQYEFYIKKGIKLLSNSNICVVGLTRNTSHIIYKTIHSLTNLCDMAKNYKIILFENDSSDNTVAIINDIIKTNNNITLLSEQYNRPQFSSVQNQERTIALAEYRNILKNHVQNNYANYDFTIVTDTDFQSFSLDGIYNSFGWMAYQDTIGAMCGNSFEYRPIFDKNEEPSLWNYDSWAYRGSWWNNLQTHNPPCVRYNPMLWFGLQILPVGSSPFRINSGFGGMSIYRNKFYFSANYSGEDCEHVMFHYNIKQNNPDFHLFLNPSQRILLY